MDKKDDITTAAYVINQEIDSADKGITGCGMKVDNKDTKSVDIKEEHEIGKDIVENNNNESGLKTKTEFWVPFNKSVIDDIKNEDKDFEVVDKGSKERIFNVIDNKNEHKDFEVVSKESKERIFNIPLKSKGDSIKDECNTDKLRTKLEFWIAFNK